MPYCAVLEPAACWEQLIRHEIISILVDYKLWNVTILIFKTTFWFCYLGKKKNPVDVTVAQSLMTLHVKTNQWIRGGGFPANVPHQAQRMGLLSQPSHCTGGDKHASPRSVRSGVRSCGSEQRFRECVPWTQVVGISGINVVKTPWRNQGLGFVFN